MKTALQALPGLQPLSGWALPAYRHGRVLAMEIGMGPARALQSLPVLESIKPDQVWLFGWCGGLHPSLDVGDLVLADAAIPGPGLDSKIHCDHPPLTDVLHAVQNTASQLKVRLLVGPALTSAHVLADAAEKQSAAEQAVAVEMEAYPLAKWATECSLPFVHLRVVLDPAASPLPKLPIDEHGYASPARVLLRLLAHPFDIPIYFDLLNKSRKARRVMAAVLSLLSTPGAPLSP